MPVIQDVHQDAVLTGVSIAYTQPGFIADLVFPRVPVKKESDKYYIYGTELFQTPSAKRAPKTAYKRINWTVSTDTYTCEEYGLEEAIDDREMANADDPLNLEIDTTELLTSQIMLARERRVAALAFSSTYMTVYTTLSGTSQWSDYVNSDPIGDVRTGMSTVQGTIGRDPNTMIISRAVFDKLQDHPAITERVKYTQLGILTVELLARLFGVERVLVGMSIYDSANEGQTDSLAQVWGKHCLLAYIEPRPGLKKMSVGYSMVAREKQVEKYRDDTIKSEIIRVSELVDEKVVSASAAYLIVNAVA